MLCLKKIVDSRALLMEKMQVYQWKTKLYTIHCEVCSIKNQNDFVYKSGTQISRITFPFLGMYPAYVLLEKQRYQCR